jgi:hypothetical protein
MLCTALACAVGLNTGERVFSLLFFIQRKARRAVKIIIGLNGRQTYLIILFYALSSSADISGAFPADYSHRITARIFVQAGYIENLTF